MDKWKHELQTKKSNLLASVISLIIASATALDFLIDWSV